MFHTNLAREFGSLDQMGLERQQILKIAQTALLGAFLPESDKSALLQSFGSQAAALGLL
jgi:adenosine deaminase